MQTHFERLGLPGRFSIDPAAVERAYLARSRELHPDFHHAGAAAEQRASLELTAALNEAYTTLRDPFRRAEYLLALRGGPTAQDAKAQEPAFLMEMMDLRERIEAGDGEIEAELTARLSAAVADIATAFARDEAGEPGQLAAVRRFLNDAKTLRSLLRELRTG